MAVNVDFDPANIADCEKAVATVSIFIELYHGPAAARRLFLLHTKSRRDLQRDANVRLMVAYLTSGISAERCARDLAEKNKSLPHERRYGRGSTNPEALKKQIRREKKRLKVDARYRQIVEAFVEMATAQPQQPPASGTFRNKVSGDISKQIGS